MSVQELERRIEAAFASGEIAPAADAVEETIRLLDGGELRVAELQGDEWVVNEWAKKAILLFFRLQKLEPIEVGPYVYHDKICLLQLSTEDEDYVIDPLAVKDLSPLSGLFRDPAELRLDNLLTQPWRNDRGG